MKKLLTSAALILVGVLTFSPAAYAVSYSYKNLRSLTATTDSTVTITTGSTFYTALAANPLRKQCYIMNQTGHTMTVFLGSGTAAASKSVTVATGNNYNCATAGVGVVTDKIQVTTTTSSDVVGVIEMQ